MQISIDTSKDSHDDIRRAIMLLQSIVSGGEVRTNAGNIFDNPIPESSPASLMGMFDSSPQPQQAEPSEPEEPSVQSGVELY